MQVVDQEVARRPAAILVADVAEYSRHLSRDEAGTFARVKAAYQHLVRPLIRDHGGRVVKTTGDGLLAGFPEPLGAVRCALELLRLNAERQHGQPPEARIEGRIGISFGEVIEDEGDLFGEQVAVAARLQKLAMPGGLCVTGAVYDRVAGHVDVAFHDAGEQPLRNLARPVRVFRTGGRAPLPLQHAAARTERRATIAVLPFRIPEGDPERAYLAEGIAEEILIALSQFRWFVVTARCSSFAYKDERADPAQVAAELGVQYIVEGSVRWIGDRVRVSTHVTDTATGRQVWLRHFDRTADDMFALLDELSAELVAAIEPEITEFELSKALTKPEGQLDAWDLYHRASWHFWQTNKGDNAHAKALFWEAIELDPGFARGHAGLAYALFNEAVFGYVDDPAAAVGQGLNHARQAVALDPRDPFAHHTLGRLYMLAGQHDASIGELTRALELNPNQSLSHYGLAFALVLAGRPTEAIPHLERACRLSPKDPLLWAFFSVRALGHLLLGNLDEALDWARKAHALPNAEFWAAFTLAVALAARGEPEAGAAYRDGLGRRPDFSPALFDRTFQFLQAEHREWFAGCLTRAERFASTTAA